jgi:hypothetical protein
MEQLQKVLVYRFWIIAGLTPILAIVAWRAGAGTAQYQYQTRSSMLKGTFQRIDQLAANNKAPNPKWKAAVATVLSEATEDQDETWQTLYEQQKNLFQWPGPEIAQAVAEMQAAAGSASVQPAAASGLVEPAGEISELARRFYWRRDYSIAFGALEEKLGKIQGDPQNPIVIVPDTLLESYRRTWEQTPGTQEVLEAQEDAWILSLLLDVIADVNDGATESYNAPIQEILDLQIADRVKRSASTGPLALAGAQGNQGQGNLFGGGGQQPGIGGGQGQQGMGQNQQQGGFGQPQPQAGGGEVGLGATGRYDAQTQTYKSVRFRMLLMMKHTEVPLLLVKLVNHPVPITISVLHVEGPDFINQPGRKSAPEPLLSDIGRVEVVGTLKLFNKPPEPQGTAPTLGAAGASADATGLGTGQSASAPTAPVGQPAPGAAANEQ